MTKEQCNRMINELPPKEARKLYRSYYKVYNNRFARSNYPQPYDEYYNKRIADGLKLFAKYFYDM